MRTVALLGISAVAVVTLAACGSSGGGPVTSLSPSAPAGGASGTSLTITLLDSADATPQTWTLTCDPPGGSHPDPAAACAALAAAPDPFKPLDTSMACTEVYGGPQTATVVGTYRGSPVNASFARTNGCEIARWDAIHAALGSQGGA